MGPQISTINYEKEKGIKTYARKTIHQYSPLVPLDKT